MLVLFGSEHVRAQCPSVCNTENKLMNYCRYISITKGVCHHQDQLNANLLSSRLKS